MIHPRLHFFSESLTIGSYVDGIVFVVQQGSAQKKTIEDALNMIKDFKILGVVFNNVNAANLDGHYSRYNYYGYKQKEKQ